jgi:hypothetical protein
MRVVIVMMEKLRFADNSVGDLEVLATSSADVVGQSDQLVDYRSKSDQIFLDCYLRFMGASNADVLSWRTRSFEDSQDK